MNSKLLKSVVITVNKILLEMFKLSPFCCGRVRKETQYFQILH